MKVEVRNGRLDPWAELAGYERSRGPAAGSFGASCVFVGTMRDFNAGDAVRAMHLEHYPGMTERHLEAICREAAGRWALADALLVHRVGDLRPGDPIVLMAVWAAHRAEAFEACRYLIEELKTRAPFWKKERLAAGERWVEKSSG